MSGRRRSTRRQIGRARVASQRASEFRLTLTHCDRPLSTIILTPSGDLEVDLEPRGQVVEGASGPVLNLRCTPPCRGDFLLGADLLSTFTAEVAAGLPGRRAIALDVRHAEAFRSR